MHPPLFSRLGLGTVQMGLTYGISNRSGQLSPEASCSVLRRAAEVGFAVIDTAPAYGDAEHVIAACRFSERIPRIVTKTQPLRNGSIEDTISRLDRSLALLGAIDTVLVHHAGDLDGRDGAALWQRLVDRKAAGRVKRIGISAYLKDNPERLAATFEPDVMQLPVSMIDQRLARDGTLATLARKGIEVHARSLFLQGLVFLDPAELPPGLESARNDLAAIHSRLDELGLSPLEACLMFSLGRPEIAVSIVGVSSIAELEQIVQAVRNPEPIDWDFAAIDDPVILDSSQW